MFGVGESTAGPATENVKENTDVELFTIII